MNRRELRKLKGFLNLHHAMDREILRNVKEGILPVRYVKLKENGMKRDKNGFEGIN